MPYDINGNKLESGCCEVHPWVHEPYPCSLCYSESTIQKSNKKFMDAQEKAYNEAMERDHFTQYIKETNRSYRALLAVIKLVKWILTWLEAKEFKMYKKYKY